MIISLLELKFPCATFCPTAGLFLFCLENERDPAMVRIGERRGGVCIMLYIIFRPTHKVNTCILSLLKF